MISTLDRGLTTGGIYRIGAGRLVIYSDILPPIVPIAKPEVIFLSISTVALIKAVQVVPLYALSIINIYNPIISSIIQIQAIANLTMPLPTSAIKGTTIIFDVSVELSLAPVGAVNLSFHAQSFESLAYEEFALSSSPNSGIVPLTVIPEVGKFLYKWRCHIAPEITKMLMNDVFLTYCRIHFDGEVIELARSQLVFSY